LTGGVSPEDPTPGAAAASKAARVVVAGYSTAAAALVAFLTINGASGIPGAATIGTAGLLALGLLLPAAGMLQLRRVLGQIGRAAKSGYSMQAIGLTGLLVGLVLIVVTATLSGYLVGAVVIATAAALAVAGAVLLRGYYIATAASAGGVACLMLGTALLFSGAAVVVGSNIAFEYLISQVQNTIYVDVGAALSACGCVLAAYSFFALHGRA
jgi:hypothetical protein